MIKNIVTNLMGNQIIRQNHTFKNLDTVNLANATLLPDNNNVMNTENLFEHRNGG